MIHFENPVSGLNEFHDVLQEVRSGSRNISDIKCIDLTLSRLDILPEEIGIFTSLESLRVGHCGIKHIPEGIFRNLKKLIFLHLECNFIKQLPADFCYMSSLRFVRLTRNLLSTLPDELGHLVSLEAMFLDNNLFTQFPQVIVNLPVIIKLDFNENALYDLPDVLQHAPLTLRGINLTNNVFTDIPSVIPNIPNLEFCSFSGNKLNCNNYPDNFSTPCGYIYILSTFSRQELRIIIQNVREKKAAIMIQKHIRGIITRNIQGVHNPYCQIGQQFLNKMYRLTVA